MMDMWPIAAIMVAFFAFLSVSVFCMAWSNTYEDKKQQES